MTSMTSTNKDSHTQAAQLLRINYNMVFLKL